MDSKSAAEQLQVIRTLMERSGLYRRALAPIMLFAGFLGIASATGGLLFHVDSMRTFGVLWLGTAIVAISGALLVARRQSIKERELFWSPPTRRVAQALLPPLFAGMCVGLVFVLLDLENAVALTFIWVLFYGCALHSAGFFMPRGMRLFGWVYLILAGIIFLFLAALQPKSEISAHWLMGFFFGVLHLAYGLYLYLTEKGKNAA